MIDTCKDTPKTVTSALGWWQGVWFVICTTIGMAAIAASILAQPVSRYYADQRVLHAQQQRFDRLCHIRDQQQELLANSNNPLVVQRVAINCLQYRPAVVVAAGPGPSLPELPTYMKPAVSPAHSTQPPPPASLERWAGALAVSSEPRNLLLLLGSGLLLTAMTCFYRRD